MGELRIILVVDAASPLSSIVLSHCQGSPAGWTSGGSEHVSGYL